MIACRWCFGRGCLACPPPPAPPREDPATGLLWSVYGTPEQDPEGWRVLGEVFGREALDHVFGPGGRGMEEIRERLAERQQGGEA